MNFRALVFFAVLATISTSTPAAPQEALPVKVERIAGSSRVDVRVGSEPFTSYLFAETDQLKKPVLWPVRTARGTAVTRGFPLEPRPGERVDHPHQMGVWLNHGDVSGFDFWNNSDAIPSDQRRKMGTIRHRRIRKTKSGRREGRLETEADWIAGDGRLLLREVTHWTFGGTEDTRWIDRVTRLTAVREAVTFNDSKEGLFAIRVRRELEQPATKPEIFTDASGRATAVAVLDNTGVTGEYRSSEGKVGDAVWGTRGRWSALAGRVGDEQITLAIFDHPRNPGFPTRWHARGYGLFSANPLGAKSYDDKAEPLKVTIGPGRSLTFQYRLLILSDSASDADLDREYEQFAR